MENTANKNTTAPKKDNKTPTPKKGAKSTVPTSTVKTSTPKQSKKHDQPKAFCFFVLFIGGIAFAMIAWLGSISTDFPWLILCGGCVFLAYSIGLWLWGYHSHKPEVKVKVKHVYLCQSTTPAQDATSPKEKAVENFLEAIYNDPDLQDDDDSESPEDAE